jgi:hypothetical protein
LRIALTAFAMWILDDEVTLLDRELSQGCEVELVDRFIAETT